MRNKIIPYNPGLKQFARKLRNNSTKAEIAFWKAVKGKALGVEFHRQVPIDKFIVDFYCHELQFAIEIDGSIHWEASVAQNDVSRQARLESLGVHFLRLTNEAVLKQITDVLELVAGKIEELQEKK
jgi:very-short-patch-repair endonuclease